MRKNLSCCLLTISLLSVGYAQKRPNVLFVIVDDMKPSWGCYGDQYAITPNIDDLARSGMLFENSYCQQALSGPSRASFLTGMRPQQVGVTELSTLMREKIPDLITLPQAFRINGYETYGVGKIFHGTENGRDSLSWSSAPINYKYTKKDEYQLPKNATGRKSVAVEVTDVAEENYLDSKITKGALAYIDELKNSDRPFFLSVGFLKPHLPFCMPKKYWDLYSDTDFGIADTNRGMPLNAPAVAYHNSEELRGYTDIPKIGKISYSQEQDLRHGYYACVSFIDAQIGVIIDRLKSAGLYENTIIVLLGDHGYHLGERDLWCKSTNYEASCRAPLLIANVKSQCRAAKTSEIVEFIDIYPTLLQLCGLDVASKLSGRSLCPLLEGDKWAKKYAVSQFQRPYGALHKAGLRTHMGYAIRNDRWRYIEWYDSKTNILYATELYDMTKGQLETTNLANLSKYENIKMLLSKELKQILKN